MALRPHDPPLAAGSVAEACYEALAAVGHLDGWEARNALTLGRKIDDGQRESGSSFAAMVAKLERSMALALRPRPGESFVDELRRRRLERLGRP